MRVKFKDITESSGMVVESQLKVHQRTQNGCGRLKYTINLYHTNNRVLGNGRQGTQFSHEHARVSQSILQGEQVSDMDNDIYLKTDEDLRAVSVRKPRNEATPNENSRQFDSERREVVNSKGEGPTYIVRNAST